MTVISPENFGHQLTIDAAKEVIISQLKISEPLTRPDFDAMLLDRPELALDDLDIALTQLSAARILRYTATGIRSREKPA